MLTAKQIRWVLVGLLLTWTVMASAQTGEDHEFEVISAADVGAFEPTRQPELSEVAELIVKKTNAFRSRAERSPLSVDERLQEAAREFAEYMARTGRYGHQADDRRPHERVAAEGYDYCATGENIAYKFRTKGFSTEMLAEGLVDGWKRSPGHRENMLKPHMTEIGVAVAQSEETGVYFAVQLFARPQADAIEFQLSNNASEGAEYRIGDREYSLPPQYTRRHRLCRPSNLELLREGEIASRLQPEDGDEFLLSDGADGIQAEIRQSR